MSATTVPAPPMQRGASTRYLVLSGLTGVLELGVVLWAARAGWAAWQVVGLGVCYQLASLLVRPFPLTPRSYRWLLVAGAAAGVVALSSVAAVPVAVACTAAGLQGVREEQLGGGSVSTLTKRASRILGFVGAAAFSLWFLVLLPVVVGAIARSAPVARVRRPRPPLVRPTPHEVLMVVHQSHYFAYSYVLIFVLVGLEPGRGLPAAVAFALGWISYSLVPSLFGRFAPLPSLVAGHVLVAVMLVIIAGTIGDAGPVTTAWILGGFGGGTVYCIKELGTQGRRTAPNMESWENVGHVTGSVLALVAVVVLSLPGAFVVAAAAAAATAVGAVALERSGAGR